eukprot:TRINITY_DN1097_c0_g1_i1.p1 TRINITY_DN1097_c0_g1~~TRINITY_DN1097_c0_g1_i1.p1  ORF type:complete len:387 (+),score=88.06 TRINITY_DN1097_c0_g1_i1:97-1161(+)
MSNTNIETIFDKYKPIVDDYIKTVLPKQFSQETLKKFCGEPSYAYDLESASKAVLDPIWDILSRGGKRWRPVLVMLVAEALGGKPENVLPCAYACELIHNGTLVVDDIEDDSKLRRGEPCLHLKFGIDVAVNAGNAMYFLPVLLFKELKKTFSDAVIVKAYELYVQELTNLHLGQGLDIWWHNGKRNPNIDEYLQMCAYKTGTLARLSVRLSTLLSGGSDEQMETIGKFAEAIGVAFQIQDDLLNLTGDTLGKGGCGEDIHEGKRSLMVIHSLENATEQKKARLLEILGKKTEDVVLIQEAIDIMKETKSMQFSQDKAKFIVQSAWDALSPKLTESDAKHKLKIFADFLVSRNF